MVVGTFARSTISLTGPGVESDYFIHINKGANSGLEDVAIHSDSFNIYDLETMNNVRGLENYDGAGCFIIGKKPSQLAMYQYGSPIKLGGVNMGLGDPRFIYQVPNTLFFMIGDVSGNLLKYTITRVGEFNQENI